MGEIDIFTMFKSTCVKQFKTARCQGTGMNIRAYQEHGLMLA